MGAWLTFALCAISCAIGFVLGMLIAAGAMFSKVGNTRKTLQ